MLLTISDLSHAALAARVVGFLLLARLTAPVRRRRQR